MHILPFLLIKVKKISQFSAPSATAERKIEGLMLRTIPPVTAGGEHVSELEPMVLARAEGEIDFPWTLRAKGPGVFSRVKARAGVVVYSPLYPAEYFWLEPDEEYLQTPDIIGIFDWRDNGRMGFKGKVNEKIPWRLHEGGYARLWAELTAEIETSEGGKAYAAIKTDKEKLRRIRLTVFYPW